MPLNTFLIDKITNSIEEVSPKKKIDTVVQLATANDIKGNEYLHQYSLHKLTSSYTILEMLVLGGVDFVSSLVQHNFVTAFKGLLTIRRQQVGLLRAEKDIQGRELGHIFSANEKFKQ